MTTLRDVIMGGRSSGSADPSRVEKVLSQSASMRESIVRTSGEGAWALFADGLRSRVGEILDVDLGEIMVGAWNKYRLLQDLADRDKHPPDEVNVVPIAEHTISSEHRPRFEIVSGNEVVASLEFTVTASLTMTGINVVVRDGVVMEIRLVRLVGGGAVDCHGVEIMRAETRPIDLPGAIPLKRGIPIVASGEPPESHPTSQVR